ncbi:hypothetical protein BDN72DRAFT_168269 [Pluteus cervinus]|uniref:Uncharacterized protein n=1 Tax=Pluteus cervinus TaxID=181527 RepID=A0ACD3B6C9_9AGAR|nr:hypothetical protein BDN72DRAFT_168269 [Pluteus cervinus]
MRFFAAAALASATFVAAQQTYVVAVGSNGTQTFQPPSVNANVGDTIAFQFRGGNHTATQSTFTAPCTKKSNGVDSGFFAVAAGATELPQWSFTIVNASAPLWFYCQQGKHCQNGMVFALNPTADKTLDAYKANAMASNGSATAEANNTITNKPNNAFSVAGSYGKTVLVLAAGVSAGLLL